MGEFGTCFDAYPGVFNDLADSLHQWSTFRFLDLLVNDVDNYTFMALFPF